MGTLVAAEDGYKFRRGLETFPSVGDIVILPTEQQLKSIVESGENRRVYIGNSPLIGNAKVMIDPDKLFGRHLAVLGNTGSGKSCSVAGLIRWSLECADREVKYSEKSVNSRFIVLDPNGEYSRAFADKKDAKIYTVNIGDEDDRKQLHVPLWFWNTDEWCGFTKASPKTHRTTIVHALKSVRDGNAFEEVSKQSDCLPKINGELIKTCKYPIDKNSGALLLVANSISSYYTLKQKNDSCQNLLEKCLEPMLAMAELLDKKLEQALNCKVSVAENCEQCVAIGTGKAFDLALKGKLESGFRDVTPGISKK
jgi:hypothetical protein